MKIKLGSLFSLTLIFLYSFHPSSTGGCSSSESLYPCQTYVFYRAMATEFLDLASIGDLFSTSRVMIANPSNILSPSTPLIPNQPLFVPVACSCNRINGGNTSLSYANITYKIKKGDTFFLGSTIYFQNLTDDQSIQLVNPNLIPTDLQIGTLVVIPIFCKCLNPTNYLISYVFQPSDSISSLALKFGSTSQSIVDINGDKFQPYDTIFIPVSHLPRLTQPISAHQSSRSDKQRTTIIGLAIGLGFTGLLLASVIALWGYRESVFLKKWKGSSDEDQIHHLMTRGVKGINMKGEEVDLMANISECLDKYRMFRIEELREATDGFDQRWLIQGSVYKGFIDGVLYSIKRMGWNAFEELKILHKVNHGNLVKLEGFCVDHEETGCYVVHEFVENGSLHSWLHGPVNRRNKLSWKSRLRIAIDVANGLQYIHEHTRPQVIHKDIKSRNILLDSNMRAKIANFGLARSGFNALTMHVNLTNGYAPPEYLTDGSVSTKTDVFSFGVILAELVSGKEAVDEEGSTMLWEMTRMVMEGKEEERRKRVSEWMDDAMANQHDWSIESVTNVIVVAMACLRKDPSRRPNMMEIVYALSKTCEDYFFDVSEDGGPSPRTLNAR